MHSQAVDLSTENETSIKVELGLVEAALRELLRDSGFCSYMAKAVRQGPIDTLNRVVRDGYCYFKILQSRGNGCDCPFSTFLVICVPYEAIGMPGLENAIAIEARHTLRDGTDGFAPTETSSNERFRAHLASCAYPKFLKSLILATFGGR